MNIFKCVIISILTTFILACGGNDQLPNDYRVSISPSEVDWEIGGDVDTCDYDPHFYEERLFSILVEDNSSRPIGDAEVIVTLSHAENTFLYQVDGSPADINTRLYLYHDKNGNYRADDEELVSGRDDAVFTAKTDEDTGVLNVIARINLTCVYKGTLGAHVNGVYGSAEIKIEEKPDNE